MSDGLPPFSLLAPRSVAEAVLARQGNPQGRFVAGGTDIVVNLRRGIGAPTVLIDLTRVDEMHGVGVEGDCLRIGAAVTLAAVERDPAVAAHAGIVAKAAAMVAAPAHRTAATLGGNLCLDTRCVFYNQSEWWRAANGFCLKHDGEVCHVAPTGTRCHAAFAGDLAPALMVLDAAVEIAAGTSRRWVRLADLYQDDGRAHLVLAPHELVVAVRVPLAQNAAADYAKARARGAVDFPLAGVAVALRRDGDAIAKLRVALTGTGSRPILVAGCEDLLGRALDDAALARLGKLVEKQVSPMRTTVAPAHYRRRAAAALAVRLVRSVYAAAA